MKGPKFFDTLAFEFFRDNYDGWHNSGDKSIVHNVVGGIFQKCL